MNDLALVDAHGNETGCMEKLAAHKQGLLHRAFSIFIFNNQDELLLQRRANSKYHSPGLWSNACCSHPNPGEDVKVAAHRRLQEEMGFDCSLNEAFSLTYKAAVGNGLTEYEYDHVLVGRCQANPQANPDEVQEWKWSSLASLSEEILQFPDNYTHWLKLIIRFKAPELLNGTV
ncbi:MAG: isopentenyl-diphosphate Delta-isomerase [Gammaproteobacteria bacterium]|nr:isopentenyl-diphosphate Delta-isomerase [Gammaproteobacteria bacterium]